MQISQLLSDQIDKQELKVIISELEATLANNVPGDVVEFGCYVGTTSVYLARLLDKTDKSLYLYDSFQGLPIKTVHDQSPIGTQFVAGELSASKKQLIRNLRQANVALPRIKKAWFDELNETDIPHTISFAFLDGDYYTSILDPLTLIWPYLSAGAVVVIDDYTNQALPGAAKAVDEWCGAKHLSMRTQASLAVIQL